MLIKGTHTIRVGYIEKNGHGPPNDDGEDKEDRQQPGPGLYHGGQLQIHNEYHGCIEARGHKSENVILEKETHPINIEFAFVPVYE